MSNESLIVDRDTEANMAADPAQQGLPWRTFESWMADLRNQPAWRERADKCVDYYDGNQLTAKQLSDMLEAGMAPIVANIIRPTIDVVLGMEAKTRQDWRVQSDASEFQDVAEAESALLAEAERESKADRACSDAYAHQIKAGMGWVEVSRTTNPFEYPYRVRAVHRREIWWDWRAKEPDLADARFLLRRRWVDLDELIASFPQHAGLLEDVGTGRITFQRFDMTTESASQAYVDAHTRELRTSLDDLEWRDTERRMLCLGEMWYRTWHRGYVIKVGGKVIPADTRHPAIAAAIAIGKVRPQWATYPRVRLAWWVGPHRLADIETDRRRFPYVPFWGFREDRTGAPYGLVRPMIDPQDEYNARRAKLMWLLSAKRVFMDSDALDLNYNSPADVAKEINRPDATVILNPARGPNSTVRVDTDHGLASQQFQVMKDAQELMQQTAGVYQSMMGQSGSATSGLAINSLVEQGATTLAEINDNYRYARRLVGEMLLEQIVADIGCEQRIVQVGDGKKPKTIVLNQPAPDGMTIINDVMRAGTKVALADVPSTPSYRAQQLSMLTELTKSLPPLVQGQIIDFVIESTDLPKRREMADRIRAAMGIQSPDEMTDEQRTQAQQMLDEQKAVAEQQRQSEMRDAEATAAEKEARAEKARAEAAKIFADIEQAHAQRAEGVTSPREEAMATQMQALMEQIRQVEQSGDDQRAALAATHANEMADIQRQLGEARNAVAAERVRATSAERVAEIEAQARIAEAAAETRRAEIEAAATKSERDSAVAMEAMLKPLMTELARLRESMEARKAPSADAAAPQVTVPIVVERNSGSKTGTLRKLPDGSYTMEVREKEAGP